MIRLDLHSVRHLQQAFCVGLAMQDTNQRNEERSLLPIWAVIGALPQLLRRSETIIFFVFLQLPIRTRLR